MAKIPLEDFFRNPEKSDFSLSPNGEYVAFLQPWQKRMNVYVQKLGESDIRQITSSAGRDIPAFFWVNNHRLVYLQDCQGDENYQLFGVDKDGGNLRSLTPFPQVQTRVVDRLDEMGEDCQEILIAMNRRDPKWHDVYRLHVTSGELTLVAENHDAVGTWIADHQGKVRVAVSTDGVNHSILYRDQENEAFRTVVTTNFRESLDPLFFTPDNRFLYVASNLGHDKTAIVKYDIAHGKDLETIYEHPDVDVNHLLYSKSRKVITGVYFTTWKNEYHLWDETRKRLQEELASRLPNYEVYLTSMSRDETKVIARTLSDRSLGAYYFYDTVSKEFTRLAEVSPWLHEENMAAMQPISYETRDKWRIQGYLTLPTGATTKNLPVVVLPHGGPWYRDAWGYNREVQFLANQGYAVLQMNYRGSTGYGRRFWEASFKQWGQRMQDDITDGVQWLLACGIADPKRIAIYGGSYGGYATLVGLTKTPELYACGVDYVGVSNLLTFMNSIPPYWKPYLEKLYEMVGHPQQDLEMMQAASPVFHVDKIRAPLLIAQGAQDPRVNKNESEQMVAALQRRGMEVIYLCKENEGHGFRNEENRIDFYRAMEKFLAKHLANGDRE